jgi:hypothetical protein
MAEYLEVAHQRLPKRIPATEVSNLAQTRSTDAPKWRCVHAGAVADDIDSRIVTAERPSEKDRHKGGLSSGRDSLALSNTSEQCH